jgi:hypothetical protein
MFMRAATSGTTKLVEPFLNTMFCSSCGLCEMYSCPQALSPRTLITQYKNGLRSRGVAIPKGIPTKAVDKLRDYRAVPMQRLVARLGLSEYDIEAPVTEQEYKPKQVRIRLAQHIGAKAVPVVKKDEIVQEGQPIALAAEGKLSLPVHASIAGKILEVNDNDIIINAI